MMFAMTFVSSSVSSSFFFWQQPPMPRSVYPYSNYIFFPQSWTLFNFQYFDATQTQQYNLCKLVIEQSILN